MGKMSGIASGLVVLMNNQNHKYSCAPSQEGKLAWPKRHCYMGRHT